MQKPRQSIWLEAEVDDLDPDICVVEKDHFVDLITELRAQAKETTGLHCQDFERMVAVVGVVNLVEFISL